ncbi:MAG: tetratricopeptide repeat protein, partial [Terriglobia bacterium]
HNALAWADLQSKNTAGAESEYQQSLQVNPNQGTVSALYAKLLYDDKKFPEALFEYARAAQFAGPGVALPANTRTQLMNFFNKSYQDYHGSADGATQVLAQAKTSALPPSGFNIVSATQLANQQAAQMNQRIQSDPAFKIWFSIKQSLQSQGDAFFNASVKGFQVPGGAEGVNNFTGTVISVTPSQVVLGIENPTVPDATLTFTTPLPQDALNTIKVGSQIQFSGIVDSYTANPYMLTFKDPTIPGVKTTTPPKRGRSRHSRRR